MPGVFTLTPAGQRKLERVVSTVNETLQRRVPLGVIRLRQLAAELAPSEREEAELLSRGQAAGGRFTGQTLGDPEDGRFIRAGTFSLREAIATEPVRTSQRGNRTFARTCSARRINERTGFSWMTRRRGLQGPTRPFEGKYVESLENGGAVWRVVPRPGGTKALEPETGIFTPAMVKTLPPYGMFRRAKLAGREEVRESIQIGVKGAVKRATK